MKTSLENFAATIRSAREKRKISQRDLAQKLNMNYRTILDLEMVAVIQKQKLSF